MVFGVGVGDIAKAIEICAWIWTNICQGRGVADKRLEQLGQEIQRLQEALESLGRVLPEARKELDPFERESKDIAGDFLETLETCRDLLNRHVKLKSRWRIARQNITWALDLGKQVDDLCDQLHLHTQALLLVATPIHTNFLRQIYLDVSTLVESAHWPEAMRAQARAQAQALALIPPWLSDVFSVNLTLSPPTPFEGRDGIPLRQGCEALRLHFSRLSTGDRTDEEQADFVLEYLGLLKCRWLVDALREGREFNSRPMGSPFRRFVLNVNLEVSQRIQRHTRSGVAAVTEDELRAAQRQSGPSFLIWEPPAERPTMRPWLAETGEEKMATIPLIGGDKLYFFRRGPTTMRIVPVVEAGGEVISLSQHHREMRLDIRTDSFVPLYTVGAPGPVQTVMVYQKDDVDPVEFQLDGIQAAWEMQQAITGYQVRDDEINVAWSFLRPAFDGGFSIEARTVGMDGGVQLWQWQPLAKDASVHHQEWPMSPSTASISSVSRRSSNSTATSLPLWPSNPSVRVPPSIAESQTSELYRDTELPQGTHRHLQPPVPPALVFFAQSGFEYTYLYLEMKQGLAINNRLCGCSQGDCRVMVITNQNSERFQVQRVSADGAPRRAPKGWNLSLFGGPGRPAAYRDRKTVERIDCLHVTLTFETPESRLGFSTRLQTYLSLYHKAQEEHRERDTRARYHTDRPREETHDAEGGMYGGHSVRSARSSTTTSLSGSGSGSGTGAPAIPPTLTYTPPNSAIHLPWGQWAG